MTLVNVTRPTPQHIFATISGSETHFHHWLISLSSNTRLDCFLHFSFINPPGILWRKLNTYNLQPCRQSNCVITPSCKLDTISEQSCTRFLSVTWSLRRGAAKGGDRRTRKTFPTGNRKWHHGCNGANATRASGRAKRGNSSQCPQQRGMRREYYLNLPDLPAPDKKKKIYKGLGHQK